MTRLNSIHPLSREFMTSALKVKYPLIVIFLIVTELFIHRLNNTKNVSRDKVIFGYEVDEAIARV